MSRILFFTSAALKKPMRGTPIRICKFIEALAGTREPLTVVSASLDPNPSVTWIERPQGSVLTRFLFLRKIIKERSIEVLVTPTSADIKMVMLLRFFCGVKTVIDIHGVSNEEDYFFGHIGSIKKNWRGFVFNAQLYFFDRISVVSEKMRSYYSLHKHKSAVVYGGVSLSEFPHIAVYKNVGEGPFEIAYMGNTRPYQGLPMLLEALALFPTRDFTLRLIMTGDVEEIKSLLQAYNLDTRTKFYTDIPHSEVASYLKDSDVLVIPRPSIPMTEYAYPSKLPECMATGIPVVATDVGPVREIFGDGISCVITKRDSVEDLREGLMRVYLQKAHERERMGLHARSVVEKKLSWDILGATIRSVCTF